MLTQIGAVELAAEGEEEPTVDFQHARGQDELGGLGGAREASTFDPRYGYEMVDGQPEPGDTSLSFAFSDAAKGATATGADG